MIGLCYGPKKANKRQLAASNCYWKIPSNHSETLRNRQISYDSLVHRPSLKVSKYSDFFPSKSSTNLNNSFRAKRSVFEDQTIKPTQIG